MTRSAILPSPPSTNHLFANLRGGGRIKTTLYKEWQRGAGLLLNVARLGRMAGPLEIEIAIGQCGERRDADNFVKPILDLLKSCGVISDDNISVVHDVRVRRAFGEVEDGHVRVTVRPLMREAA
jgi:Holliday junction resolvase RusA-like endonuclease